MPIETPRLILRPIMPGDGPALFDAKQETQAELKQWMSWANERDTIDDNEIAAREGHIRFLKREDMMMVGLEKETGRFVVGTGLHRFDWSIRRFEIGYWVRASAQGQGYAGEAANAITRYAFGALKANAVEIRHAEGNDKSRSVIEKLGFALEGRAKMGTSLPDGTVTDTLIYSVTSIEPLPPLDVTWPEAGA